MESEGNYFILMRKLSLSNVNFYKTVNSRCVIFSSNAHKCESEAIRLSDRRVLARIFKVSWYTSCNQLAVSDEYTRREEMAIFCVHLACEISCNEMTVLSFSRVTSILVVRENIAISSRRVYSSRVRKIKQPFRCSLFYAQNIHKILPFLHDEYTRHRSLFGPRFSQFSQRSQQLTGRSKPTFCGSECRETERKSIL